MSEQGRVQSYEELRAEVERLRAENSRLLRQSNQARHLARWLWRLAGVREQWTPPEKYELDWLTREDAPANEEQGRDYDEGAWCDPANPSCGACPTCTERETP